MAVTGVFVNFARSPAGFVYVSMILARFWSSRVWAASSAPFTNHPYRMPELTQLICE